MLCICTLQVVRLWPRKRAPIFHLSPMAEGGQAAALLELVAFKPGFILRYE